MHTLPVRCTLNVFSTHAFALVNWGPLPYHCHVMFVCPVSLIAILVHFQRYTHCAFPGIRPDG